MSSDTDEGESGLASESELINLSELIDVCRESGVDIKDATSIPRRSEVSEICDQADNGISSPTDTGTCEMEIMEDEDSSGSRRAVTPADKVRNRKSYTRYVNHEARMYGKPYVGFGKNLNPVTNRKRTPQTVMRSGRELGPPCTSDACAKKPNRHCKSFSAENRQEIFDSIWKTMTWKQKMVHIRSLVDQKIPVKSKAKSKETTYLYYLKLNGERKQVCKVMFMQTTGLKEKQVRGWLKKTAVNVTERVKIGAKTTGGDKSFYKEFLHSLPKLESHYCRSDSSKLYLETIFSTMTEVYKVYTSECILKSIKPTSRTTFYYHFKKKNYSLYIPKKDMCDTCSSFKTGNMSEEDYNAHVRRKDAAREEKRKDKKLALSGDAHVVTMDVQKVLLSPALNASATYYKTKLVTHNFTLVNAATQDATCYLWDECQSDMSASAFASCVLKYFDFNFKDDRQIILYSDGCTNQNRNGYLSGALLQYAITTKKVIIQKYLEKGHTQNDCDQVHALLERKIKGKPIFHPNDYTKLFQIARANPHPFIVNNLKYTDFWDYSKLKCNIRPGCKTGDAVVTELRQIRYNINGSMDFKLNHGDDWSPMPRKFELSSTSQPQPLHKNLLPITKRKYQDLQDLLPVLPSHVHEYYKTLPFK